jgi:hypothetical protein
MKSPTVFNGEKEAFVEWLRYLKMDLLRLGIYNIATNDNPRPADIAEAFWHADAQQASNYDLLSDRRREAQRRWDSDNGKAYSAIISALNPELQKRYDEEDNQNSGLASWLLTDLRARYGGAYDEKIIAIFLVESQKAILPSVRFETWSASWESLQRKMGKSIAVDHVELLAQMRLVLGKSGIGNGGRFEVAYQFADQSNYGYEAFRNHLISKDKLINSSNIFNAGSVSFGEEGNTVKQIIHQDEREYYTWDSKESPQHSKKFDSNSNPSNYNSSYKQETNRDRRTSASRDGYNSANRYNNNNNNNNSRDASRRDYSRERYSKRDRNTSGGRNDGHHRSRERSNSEHSCDSRVSRDSRDNISSSRQDDKRRRDSRSLSSSRESKSVNSGRTKSSSVCFNWQDGKCTLGENCRYSHDDSIRFTTDSTAEAFRRDWLQTFSLQIDSGAAKTITGDISIIENYVQFPVTQYMYTITGSRISILGSGTVGSITTFYSPEADSGVVATKDLQMRGLMTIFPAGKDSGCYVIDPVTGAIIIEGDKNYNIDVKQLQAVQDAGNNSITSTVQEVNKTTENSIHTTKSKFTIYDKSIQYRVADTQRTYGFCSKQQLLGYSRSINNFPVASAEINKYFVEFPQYKAGHMTRKSFTSDRTLHTEALQIGDIVSTDCIKFKDHGCASGGVQLFLDKKSQYVIGILTKGEGNAQELSHCLNNVKNFYNSYNHTLTVVSGDALPTYRSEEYEANVTDQKARREESAPFEHEQNAVERFVRNIEAGVTAIKFSAPWVPLKLIAFLIMLWISLWNLQEGSTKGVSRYEAFTKRRPSTDAGARPGVYGDAYMVNKNKSQREGGHFEDVHGEVCMYLTPNSQSKDAHWFYKPTTDRVVSRRSFDRIAGIPPTWLNGKSDTGRVYDEDGKLWDFVKGPQQYDVWHLGATSEAVAMDRQDNITLSHNITYDTLREDVLSKENLPLEIQTLQPTSNLSDSLIQEVLPPTNSENVQSLFPNANAPDISSRTRSAGPAEDLSIRSITYSNASEYYQQTKLQSKYIPFLNDL